MSCWKLVIEDSGFFDKIGRFKNGGFLDKIGMFKTVVSLLELGGFTQWFPDLKQ